ncbi:hypothetical protein E2C01_001429 [Portunus trituberculatus]|uniref:Uncharacterized protein n=1 Tax=Portunus trituberculatus TaxID=210409 RepID=A0A5B7CHT7_PORTR|nr:hypothetical protein [Portunus trituberculatus]
MVANDVLVMRHGCDRERNGGDRTVVSALGDMALVVTHTHTHTTGPSCSGRGGSSSSSSDNSSSSSSKRVAGMGGALSYHLSYRRPPRTPTRPHAHRPCRYSLLAAW